MKLKTGVDPTSWVSFQNTRGLPFHGMGAFVGSGKTQRAHVFTAASIPVDPEAYKKIDPKKLAQELEVDMCAVNHGRFWMMDEIKFLVSEVQSFHGVELRWGGDMTGAEMLTQFESAYVPSLNLIKGGALLLDVRAKIEAKCGMAPGAMNIPVLQLKSHLSELPRDRVIVTYCGTGARAGKAKELLEASGFNVANGGGYKAIRKLLGGN
jgi:rhodanese-related sulfurtransferase